LGKAAEAPTAASLRPEEVGGNLPAQGAPGREVGRALVMRSEPTPGHPRCPLDLCPIARRPVNRLSFRTGRLKGTEGQQSVFAGGLPPEAGALHKIRGPLKGRPA